MMGCEHPIDSTSIKEVDVTEASSNEFLDPLNQQTLQSSTQYSGPIARLYSGSVLMATWYADEGHGIHKRVQSFEGPSTITWVEFYEGSEIVGNNLHEIEWIGPWKYERIQWPFGAGQSSDKNTSTTIWYDLNEYGSHIIEATYRHRITSIDAPSIPVLQTPVDGFNATSNFIAFTWSESSGSGTITYRLQIADNSNFSSTFFDESGITNTNKSVGNFSPGEKYYWRVRAQNEAGTGDWSTVWSFTASLGFPQVSGSIENGRPKLTWSPVSQADYYEIFKRSDASGWLSYASTGSTSYVDIMADVTGYQGTWPLSTPYIAYYVVARANNGAKSPNSSEHYYDYSGFTPLGEDRK